VYASGLLAVCTVYHGLVGLYSVGYNSAQQIWKNSSGDFSVSVSEYYVTVTGNVSYFYILRGL
jgi:hypothetical protein